MHMKPFARQNLGRYSSDEKAR